MMRLLLACALLVGLPACLGDTGTSDLGVASGPDLSVQRDLAGLDLSGLTNCTGLNQCEQLCSNNMCVAACRQMATPTAVSKEVALQSCFNTACPQEGTNAICAPDAQGKRSAACLTCIANTQRAQTLDCSPTTAPECRACYQQLKDCLAD